MQLMRKAKASDEERYAALTAYNNALAEQEGIEFRLNQLRKGMTPSETASSVARRLGAERRQVGRLRTDIGTGQALGDAAMEQAGRAGLARNLRQQSEIIGEITGPVMEAMRGLTNLPFMGALGGGVRNAEKAQADLLAAALRLTTLKVIIKGVDE